MYGHLSSEPAFQQFLKIEHGYLRPSSEKLLDIFRIEIKVFDRMLGCEKNTFWEKLKALSGFL